jgi:hypothetical protein
MKGGIGKVAALTAGLLGCYVFGYAWRDLQSGDLPSSRALNALVGDERIARADLPAELQPHPGGLRAPG